MTFLVIGLTAYRCGDAGQRAAEAAVARQGFPADLLARHRVRIAESLAELMLPLATWILQPVLLVAGGFITASQVFAHRFVLVTLGSATVLLLLSIH